ncbi:hypothetical protein K7432_012538 [Basidiobolus ranarum]|uniref:Glycine-rich protein n=1 Tax=Basidiobolus ranarum TaxID=34480 RepID=A0ABR2WKM6_9FUNG
MKFSSAKIIFAASTLAMVNAAVLERAYNTKDYAGTGEGKGVSYGGGGGSGGDYGGNGEGEGGKYGGAATGGR